VDARVHDGSRAAPAHSDDAGRGPGDAGEGDPAGEGAVGLPLGAPVRSCDEAGRDGFWLHRWLVAHPEGVFAPI
jgi:hypothetical protein